MLKLKSKWPSLEDLRIWFSGILSKFVPDIQNAYKNTTGSGRGKLKVLTHFDEGLKTNKKICECQEEFLLIITHEKVYM